MSEMIPGEGAVQIIDLPFWLAISFVRTALWSGAVALVVVSISVWCKKIQALDLPGGFRTVLRAIFLSLIELPLHGFYLSVQHIQNPLFRDAIVVAIYCSRRCLSSRWGLETTNFGIFESENCQSKEGANKRTPEETKIESVRSSFSALSRGGFRQIFYPLAFSGPYFVFDANKKERNFNIGNIRQSYGPGSKNVPETDENILKYSVVIVGEVEEPKLRNEVRVESEASARSTYFCLIAASWIFAFGLVAAAWKVLSFICGGELLEAVDVLLALAPTLVAILLVVSYRSRPTPTSSINLASEQYEANRMRTDFEICRDVRDLFWRSDEFAQSFELSGGKADNLSGSPTCEETDNPNFIERRLEMYLELRELTKQWQHRGEQVETGDEKKVDWPELSETIRRRLDGIRDNLDNSQ